MADYRALTLRGALDGSLRTATYRGRQHTVVPVVALVAGVVHAVNAKQPELVTAEELARTFAAWNGQPAMLDHPERNGLKVSANDPEILDEGQVGQVFNAAMKGDRLTMEAYLDPARMDVVGEKARSLLATLEAGGTVEVSVGAFITIEPSEGEHNGQRYTGTWRDIVPDHLALLPDGTRGACSVDAGCGAGVARAAASGRQLVTAEGDTMKGLTGRSLRERLASLLTFRTDAGAVEDMSDSDVRRALDSALRATEPAYLGVESVFPTDNTVIYAVAPEDKVQFFKRTYALSDAKEISFDGERVEVEPITRYEPVTAAAAAGQVPGTIELVAQPCGCHSTQQRASSAEEKTVHKNAERITALIANPKTAWTEQDRAHLETQPDERLTTLEAALAEPVAPVTKPEITLADLPEGWRKAIEAQAAQELAERNTGIEALAAAQTVFTKAELEAMPTEQLKKMATLAAAPVVAPTSFGARTPAQRTAAEDTAAPPPLDYNGAIRAAAAAKRS
jgi:hypothetical protein